MTPQDITGSLFLLTVLAALIKLVWVAGKALLNDRVIDPDEQGDISSALDEVVDVFRTDPPKKDQDNGQAKDHQPKQ
jgi:hypothetical protein